MVKDYVKNIIFASIFIIGIYLLNKYKSYDSEGVFGTFSLLLYEGLIFFFLWFNLFLKEQIIINRIVIYITTSTLNYTFLYNLLYGFHIDSILLKQNFLMCFLYTNAFIKGTNLEWINIIHYLSNFIITVHILTDFIKNK